MEIEDEFASYFDHYLEKQYPTGRSSNKLNISSLPYCGLRHAYHRLLDQDHTISFDSSYYFGVGTVLHDCIQHYLGFGKRLYSSWKCVVPKCGGSRLFSNINTCPICHAVMNYRELRVGPNRRWPNISVGFVDGLYRSKDKKWFAIDYKSTSQDALAHLKAPYINSVAQVKTYCPLLELEYEVEMEGWILVYSARDRPKNRKVFSGLVSDRDKRKTRHELDKANAHYGLVKAGLTWPTIKTLIAEKPCQTEEYYQKHYSYYPGCPLAPVCFGDELKPYVKRLFLQNS